MKDIDFEELDRAVSSLIGGASDAKKTTDSSSSPEPAAPETTKIAVHPEKQPDQEEEPKPAATHETEDALVPSAPLISSGKRPSGRFMDVVHPSTNLSKPSAAKPSKTGKVLHPISDTVKPDDPSSAEAPHTESAKPEEDTTPVAVTHHNGYMKNDSHEDEAVKEDEPKPEEKSDEPKWPDPLDVLDKPDSEKPAEPEHHEIAPDAPDPLANQPEATTAPFIADAKVEKRPLGAFSDEADGEKEEKESDDKVETLAANDAADSQMPAIAQKLPPELEGDIVNVELSEASGPASDPEPTADESQNLEEHEKEQLADNNENDKAAEKAEKQEDEEHNEHAKSHSAEHAEHAASGAVLTQTMSIPKQYHAADEQPDTAEHPVFDTKEYHPPIDPHAEHAGKHSIIWIVVAVILLAGTMVAFGYWVLNGL